MARRRKKKSRFPAFLIFIIIIAVIGFAGFNFWKGSLGNAYKPGDATNVAINIPSGSSTGSIARALEENGIVRSATAFKYYVKFSGNDGKLQAGDYNLSPSMTGEQLVKALLSGKNNTLKFTIPEGYSAEQTARALADKGFGDYDAFIDVIENGDFSYDFIDKLGYNGQGSRLEGVLFPDTYEVYEGSSEYQIIDKMLSEFDKVFTDEYYARMSEMGLSLRDTLSIASIIEREAKINSDRPLISSVIYNRLNIGMKLQMCSTVQYILGEPKEFLTNKDISIESPYNTYKNNGLPPGPICSPGKASIEAALYPADTDYLYFVVSEKLDGSHNFSSNSKDFEKDKAAYKQAVKNQ